MSNNKRDSEGRFASKGITGPVRDNPWKSAGIAAGVAAAGAFLWSRRDQITDTINSGMDSLSEAKSRRMGGKSQEEISQEAMTLKETGRKTRGPRGPLAQHDIKAGVAGSNHEMKAGAQAFS